MILCALAALLVGYAAASTSYIMHFSDVHIDPDYKERSNPKQMCIKGSGDASAWGEPFTCNGNFVMLEGLLNSAIKKFGADRIKLATFTGDLVPAYLTPSAFREHYEERVLDDASQTNIFMRNIFRDAGIPLLITRGNHDNAFVSNYAWYDPKFTDFLTDLWEDGKVGYAMRSAILKTRNTNKISQSDISYVSMGQDIETAWKAQSFYVSALPFGKKDMWVISLDSNLCDFENVFYDFTREKDPLGMWAWFEGVMERINEVNTRLGLSKNVLVMSHHPYGYMDGSSPATCVMRMDDIFSKYEDDILIHVAGHTHSNDLSVRDGSSIFTEDAGSTQSYAVDNGTFPTATFIEIDDDTFEIVDIHRFYYDIVKSKHLTRNQLPEMLSVSYKQYFGISRLTKEIFVSLYSRAKSDINEFTKLMLWPRTLGMIELEKYSQKKRVTLICSLIHTNLDLFNKCKEEVNI